MSTPPGPDATSSVRTATRAQRTEMAVHWRIVIASILAVWISTLPSYSFSIFIEPLSTQFNSSRTTIAGWSLCWSAGCILLAPIMGYLVDAFGARRVLLVALPSFAVVLLAVSMFTTSLSLLLIGGFAIGAASTGLSAITCGRLIAGYFDRQLGTALGLMSCGIGLSAVVGPSVMQQVVDTYGWQTGFRLMGIGAAIGIPAIWLLSRTRVSTTPSHKMTPAFGLTLSEALKTRAFWILGAAACGFGICIGGAAVNMMPFLQEIGFSRGTAALLLGVFGITTLAGRFLTGLAIDRIRMHISKVMAGILLGLSAIFLVFGFGSPLTIMFAVAVFGFTIGAETDCLIYCVVRVFGRKAYGSIFAILGIAMLYIGTGVGPMLLSAMSADSGSYRTGFVVWAMVAAVTAGLFALSSRPYLKAPDAPGQAI